MCPYPTSYIKCPLTPRVRAWNRIIYPHGSEVVLIDLVDLVCKILQGGNRLRTFVRGFKNDLSGVRILPFRGKSIYIAAKLERLEDWEVEL